MWYMTAVFYSTVYFLFYYCFPLFHIGTVEKYRTVVGWYWTKSQWKLLYHQTTVRDNNYCILGGHWGQYNLVLYLDSKMNLMLNITDSKKMHNIFSVIKIGTPTSCLCTTIQFATTSIVMLICTCPKSRLLKIMSYIQYILWLVNQ